jgi:TRAP-type C4-dicarboxylate transport system substrate-binding protein
MIRIPFRPFPARARHAAALALAVAIAAMPWPAGAEEKPIELKLSVAVGPAYPLGKAAELWAKRIAEASGGRLAVKVFPGAALSQRNAAREFGALKAGAADLAVGSTLNWYAQVKALDVVALPWLAPGPKQLAALLAPPVGDRLLAAVEREGVVPLALAPLGHRALATADRVLQAPGEFSGARVRVLGPLVVGEFYAALGAEPRIMAFADAEAAFAAHVLDAQDGTLALFVATRASALGLKRVLLWEAIAEAAVFAVNRDRWETWNEADRAIVRDAARAVAADLGALVQRDDDAAARELGRLGMTVTRLTAAGRAAFVAAMRGYYDRRATLIGADLVKSAEDAVATAAQ